MKQKLSRAYENRHALMTYFVLAAYLHPRGFSEVSGLYKGLFTLALYGAMVMILCWGVVRLVRGGLRFPVGAYVAAGYYVLFIGITLFLQRGLNEGLQKLFAAPALIFFTCVSLRCRPKAFLEALANTLLVILGLHLLVNPLAEALIGRFHVNFLGHVQISTQYGILGIFTAYLLFKLHPKRQGTAVLLLGAAIVTVWQASTLVGSLMLLLLGAGVAVLKLRQRKLQSLGALLRWDNRIYLLLGFLAAALLLCYANLRLDIATGKDALSIGGRTFVWRAFRPLFLERMLLGYGAFGVEASVFWSGGMNYAHSELLQQLMDGGVVLLGAYLLMLAALIGPVNRVKDRMLRAFTNLCLLTVLLMMCAESITQYNHMTVFFCLLAYLPKLEQAPGLLPKPRQIQLELSPNGLKSRFCQLYYPFKIRRTAKRCGQTLYVGGKSYVTAHTVLGENVNFNGMAIHGEGKVTIGDNFHSGTGCQIITSFHNYDRGEAIPYDTSYIHKDVTIGDNVWLGNNVIILGGVTIGEGAIIQAGSVVCKDIPPLGIAGGHPAAAFRYRDREHYETLKAQKKFH